jgi:cephalosporin-C deacetylase
MAIAELERFMPNADRPAEFLRFWDRTVAQLRQTPAAPRIEHRGETAEQPSIVERISYASLDGVRIRGYLLRSPMEHACPLIVHAHGYNDRYEVMGKWAERGFHVLGFDARGFGRSASSAETSGDGYVLTGIESPETSILRGAVADYLQAARAGKEVLRGDFTTVNFHGFSFGGALALMAAALSSDVDFIAVGQPTFGWNDERRRVALGGSTQQVNTYLEKYPWRLDTVTRTLEHFDTLHFAPLIKAPALIGIGLDDDVVPSRTVLAVANHIRSPVEVRLLPVSHSADPRESLWAKFDDEWLRLAADGVPRDYGTANRQVRLLTA